MNEHLQNILADTLEKASAVGGEIYDATKKGLGKAVDFASEQIPDVITQLMKWEFAYHAIWAAVSLFFIILMLGLGKMLWKWSNKHNQNAGEYFLMKIPMWIAIVISCITFSIGVVGNATTCAKIYYAPKVFLLEYCADLVESRKINAKLPPNDINRVRFKHSH